LPVSAEQNPESSELSIRGMTCASCVRRVEKALGQVSGVGSASVNFATERALVTHAPDVSDELLIRAVASAGYEAAPFVTGSAPEDASRARSSELRNLIASIGLTVPAILISMLWPMRPEWTNWVLFALGTPVVFGCGRQFFSTAWKAAAHGSATMDTLVALGAGAAWASSVYALAAMRGPMQSEFVYFETGSTIVTLILLGRYLESGAQHSMTDAIGKLLDLAPKMANLRSTDGAEQQVPVESLQVGDVLRVKPGEKAPVDGVVTRGESYFDESLLTGESAPVRRQPDDPVVGGSLNGSGSIDYRVTRILGDSRLTQIARIVEQAQGSKAPVQRLADNVSSVFVPVVIVIALATFLVRLIGFHMPFSAAMLPAVAILVIACPCALGLATPTAIVAGTGRGAQLGILIRDGAVLERAKALSTILLDKTGTLTEGRPTVTRIQGAPGYSDREILKLAGSIEALSEHPFAAAIGVRCREQGIEILPVMNFSSQPGQGVSGRVGKSLIQVGNARFAANLPPSLEAIVDECEHAGQTVVRIGLDSAVVGVLAISDPIRQTSSEAILEIKRLGLTPVMLTGDRESTAAAVGAALGIEKLVSEVLPERKAEVVAGYRSQGGVGMVGDGVNDAPALATADVGLAMGGGSDIAKETAGIILLRNDLRAVPQAIRLARQTVAVIRQNLVWAFGYNLVAIPVAMTGHLNPMIASAAMAFSSLSVVLNSLRLRRFV
jgi:Cu+-exporting ATPase